ncbi:MAG: hypothetical protein HRT35_33145, partial [Algicola sp.]|nr:hypothetical protein [Algicola sp.]
AFKTGLDHGNNLNSINVSTQSHKHYAATYDKHWERKGDLTDAEYASNVMRVIKGHENKKRPLKGSTIEAENSVAFGTTIGTSEYLRGGANAVTGAMVNLYKVKHGMLTTAQWSDPVVGFVGSGAGGADRLRSQEEATPREMFSQFTTKQLNLGVARTLGKGKVEGEGYKAIVEAKTAKEKRDAWMTHKYNKWAAVV